MCLTIRLEPSDMADNPLRDLGRSDQPQSMGWRFEGRSRLGRHAARLTLHGCELLAEDADPDAPTWSMSPAAAQQLAESFASLLDQIEGSVRVEAMWEGDKPQADEAIGRASFVDLVRRSGLGTRTRYLVVPAQDH